MIVLLAGKIEDKGTDIELFARDVKYDAIRRLIKSERIQELLGEKQKEYTVF